MIKTIPLNKLVASQRNVRRSADDQADLQLKADIEARGLLQNLVVTSVPKSRGSFAVQAGGRRLRALQRLAEEGKLANNHEVCCLVIECSPADAQEASLAENFQRLRMNPADECLAFQQLVDQGVDAAGIAARFGLTARFVEGRLRLAALAPVVFDALGSGEISLDVAKAYAATPDQDRQAFVFEQMSRGYGAAHPDSIRRMMTQTTASATDRRARFVGEEDYVAAGGRIERDLFADDAGTRWLDVALLERLACEKMDALAAQRAAESGLGWIRPTLEGWIGYAQTEGLRRLAVESPPLTDEESASVDVLDREIEGLVAGLEVEEASNEARAETEAKIRELGDRIDAIINKPPVINDDVKPNVGAFLILDEHGRPKLDKGLYTEIPADDDHAHADEENGSSGGSAGKPGRAAGLSQRLIDELAMQRRDILAVHVAVDPGLALDLAIFLMIDVQRGHTGEKSGSSLAAFAPSNPVFDFKTPEAPATVAQAEATGALDQSWIDGKTRAGRFDAFRLLPDEARAAWLGYAVARTLEASSNIVGQRACAFHDHLGQLLGIDVARWWRPTGANYFDRVPKAVTLAALAEVGGSTLAERYSSAKKAELAQFCERIFAGDFIGEVEVKDAALAWIPEAMRFAPEADEATADGTVPAEEERVTEDCDPQDRDPADNLVEEAA